MAKKNLKRSLCEFLTININAENLSDDRYLFLPVTHRINLLNISFLKLIMTFFRHLTNVCRTSVTKNVIARSKPFILSNNIGQNQQHSNLLFKNNVLKRNLASEAEKRRKHDPYSISITSPITHIAPDDIGPELESK